LFGVNFNGHIGFFGYFIESVENQGSGADSSFVLKDSSIDFIGLLNKIIDGIGIVLGDWLTQLGSGEHGITLTENTIISFGELIQAFLNGGFINAQTKIDTGTNGIVDF
jgi:hypothetical protein